MLTGRNIELDDLSDRIRRGESIELYGGEGYGKTSLLNLLMHDRPDLKGYFADGVVSISGRRVAPGDLIGSLFRTFFESDAAIALSEAEMLRLLSPVRALVVLDDLDIDGQEFQEVIASLSNPVFLVTSPTRRLPDMVSSAVGPMTADDLMAVAVLRLGHDLDDRESQLLVELSHLVDDRPRSWARAIGLIESVDDIVDVTSRMSASRDPHLETVRLSLDHARPDTLATVALLSELDVTSLSVELLGEVLAVDDVDNLVADIDRDSLGMLVDGCVVVDDDVTIVASDRLDGERVVSAAFDRLMEWSEHADSDVLIADISTVTAFSEWAIDHGRADDVVELGRRVDGSLFRVGRWGAAAALLALIRRAGEACDRPADTAWALHQLGVRELALGDDDAARAHLRDARSIRRRIGDKTGEALTQHHLRLLGPVASIATPVAAKLLIAVGVGVAALIAGILLVSRGGGDVDPDVLGDTETSSAPTILGPMLAPVVSAALEGETSVVVTVVLAGDRQPGDDVQVSRLAPDGSETILVQPADSDTIVDRGLNEETTYGYRARVVGAAEPSPWSELVNITTGRRTDTDAPDAPTDLSAVLDGPSVVLEWTAPLADDVAGYEVLRDGNAIAQNVEATEFVDQTPVSGAVNTYQVVAFDETGNISDPSESREVDVPGTRREQVPAPTNLRWDFDPAIGVTLVWDGAVDTYRIREDRWSRSVLVSEPRLVDGEVVAGQTVTYTVWAVSSINASAPASLTFTIAVPPPPPPPPAPGRPTVTLLGSVVRIQWPAVDYAFPVTYEVRRGGSVVAAGVGGTSTDEPLPADGTYSYTVVAVNSRGVRSAPSPATEMSIPTSPTNPTTTPTSPTNPTTTPTNPPTSPTNPTNPPTTPTSPPTTPTDPPTTPPPTTPPPQPASNLSGYYFEGQTFLDWSPSPDSNTYRVRRIASGVTTDLGLEQGVGYLDTTSPPGGNVTYEITAVRDVMSSTPITIVIFVDDVDPSPVSGLGASPSGSTVSLGWNPATDNDAILEYEVVRSVNGGAATFLGFTTTPNFDDTDGVVGELDYVVVAIDASGNRSSGQSVHIDNQDPAPPTNLSYDPASYILSWTASTSNDVIEYDIFDDDGYLESVQSTSFLVTTCGFSYWVESFDDFENSSTPTNSIFVSC